MINEHKRAHRSAIENKQQILEDFYFPQMRAKIEKILKECSVCKEHIYERHPNKPEIQRTPIPQYPGHIVHIDLYWTCKQVVLTAIDKFSKYAQAKIVKSRATQHVKQTLEEVLTNFGIPKIVVIDNEKSLSSGPIRRIMQEKYNIEVFKTPPYHSAANGQIERFHSTLSEIMRCQKAEKLHSSIRDLIGRSIIKYNNSIHSTTNRKPVDLFFGRKVANDHNLQQAERQETIEKIINKQEKDLEFHNDAKDFVKTYKAGDEIYVKNNKRHRKKEYNTQPYIDF